MTDGREDDFRWALRRSSHSLWIYEEEEEEIKSLFRDYGDFMFERTNFTLFVMQCALLERWCCTEHTRSE